MPDFMRFTPAVGRLLMVAVFFFAGIGKLAAPAATKTYIATGLPYPDLAYWLAVAVELGVAALFLLGFQTRLTAAVLALFSIATALAFHHNLGDQTQIVNFLKNFAIAGGFLQAVAFGGGACSLDALVAKRSR
ncbi:DoxX family protein [Methylocella sp.]|jgi:putative oxidoreductase|uniref:DoxX family protein n=1 Tax=Methylocella sp. TaxID=1978226 RepID=UPI003C1E6D1E